MRHLIFLLAFVLTGCSYTYHPVVTSPPMVTPEYQGALTEHIRSIGVMLAEATRAVEAAQQASDLTQMRQAVDLAFGQVWGAPSGLVGGAGAAHQHGWKTRWQATYSDFDPAYAARYGSAPPHITNPAKLGIVGRGRYIRRVLAAEGTPRDGSAKSKFIISLNNLIGWTRLDDGVTKAERQPRIDLTYRWDADQDFWRSSADTGWIFEVQAQSLNILKSRYKSVTDAQGHLDDLAYLITKCLEGQDTNNDGLVAPVENEGGYRTAVRMAQQAGLL